MTTILEVEVAPDLKTAKVYVSVMGDEESKKSTLSRIKKCSILYAWPIGKEFKLT